MNNPLARITSLALGGLLIAGCATHEVRTTAYTPVITDEQYVPEEFLMDVGVAIFNPGLDEIDDDDVDTVNHNVRVAESRYAPYLLADTLIRSGNWGIVYVMPNESSPMDIRIDGTILRSTGESMAMRVRVSDSTGREWYTREYDEAVSQFSYDPDQLLRNDPFQNLYSRIANDLLAYRNENVDFQRITELRAISEMRFAQRFAPAVYADYLTQSRQGDYELAYLPAESDPAMRRIREIRERDFMFIDTVQDYYSGFSRDMRALYDSWREQSYRETLEMLELKQKANRQFALGAAMVLGGLVTAGNADNYAELIGGSVSTYYGADIIRNGFRTRQEIEVQIEALEELGASLEREVTPQVIQLDDDTIVLSGTVEEQYSEWREILADLYALERGETPAQNPPTD